MKPLPASYAWLAAEPGPKMLLEALKLYGMVEGPGERDNPTILAWAAEVGIVDSYTRRFYVHDAQPWCGLFVALCALRAGKRLPPKQPLWAMNWSLWGEDGGQPELGDVLVFQRPSGGHVGLYVGEDDTAYHVIGGNQSNAVTISRIDQARLRACRQSYFTKPANVRPVRLAASGELSGDEA